MWSKNKIQVLRYCIEFSYNGEKYFGYQIQPKQISVQETLEQALSTILREEIKTTGAGRTDTGVHAKKMFAHFDTDLILEEELLPKRLNSFLPPDISVKRLFRVSSDFHARFDATYRTYEYYISLEKNPFTQNSAWGYWRRPLNLEAMNEACKILFEYTDFTSFSKLNTDTKTNLCEIYKAFWVQEGAELKFTISANRFFTKYGEGYRRDDGGYREWQNSTTRFKKGNRSQREKCCRDFGSCTRVIFGRCRV
ncbi:Pseudouridylate synthase [Riemerella anatipestifer]|nr:Pseudouridylate synthase [Riemerella anatipestifer]